MDGFDCISRAAVELGPASWSWPGQMTVSPGSEQILAVMGVASRRPVSVRSLGFACRSRKDGTNGDGVSESVPPGKFNLKNFH